MPEKVKTRKTLECPQLIIHNIQSSETHTKQMMKEGIGDHVRNNMTTALFEQLQTTTLETISVNNMGGTTGEKRREQWPSTCYCAHSVFTG